MYIHTCIVVFCQRDLYIQPTFGFLRRKNYDVLFILYIYGLKIFQPPVSEKFLKSRSLNHRITEINYDT